MRQIKLIVPGLSSFYQIDESGQVYQEEPLGVIKPLPYTFRSGYRVYKLIAEDGKSLSFPAHRLVAMAFMRVDLAKRRVKFLDGNTGNPALSNLEVGRKLRCTQSDAATDAARVKRGRMRVSQDDEGDDEGEITQRIRCGSMQMPDGLESMRAMDIAERWSCGDIVRIARSVQGKSATLRATLRDALMFRSLLVGAKSNGGQ